MDRQRTADDIKTIRDFLTLVPGGEKAKFYCEGGREGDRGVPPGMGGRLAIGTCGKNLSGFNVSRLPNNGEDYFVTCPRCGRTIYFNAGWIAAAILQAQARKQLGQSPAVGATFRDVKGAGSEIRHMPLPDGRKLIIAVPRAAAAGGHVPHGG